MTRQFPKASGQPLNDRGHVSQIGRPEFEPSFADDYGNGHFDVHLHMTLGIEDYRSVTQSLDLCACFKRRGPGGSFKVDDSGGSLGDDGESGLLGSEMCDRGLDCPVLVPVIEIAELVESDPHRLDAFGPSIPSVVRL